MLLTERESRESSPVFLKWEWSLLWLKESAGYTIPDTGRECLMSSQWCWTCCIFQLTCFSYKGSILVKLCLFFFLIGFNWSLKVHYPVPGNRLSNIIHLSPSGRWHNFMGQGTPECSAVLIFGSTFIHHGENFFHVLNLYFQMSGPRSKYERIGLKLSRWILAFKQHIIG